MGAVIRSLPVIQNWDCHSCGLCCQDYTIHVSHHERERIEAQDWSDEIGQEALFVRKGFSWVLQHRPNGDCVFLDENRRCRIHGRLGADAKPLNCRIYPFVLIPVADHWRVGLRYSCPSVAANQGRGIASHQAALLNYSRALADRLDLDVTSPPPPPLSAQQRVSWTDLELFVQAIVTIIKDRSDPLERRLRKCLGLVQICRVARFDKVTGPRLAEFLEIIQATLHESVPTDPASLPPPDWIGRVLFRQILALITRKDQGPNRGIGRQGRLTLTWAAWQFLRGTGDVPRLHAALPAVTFEQIVQRKGAWPSDADMVLERYYRVKLESYQFFGRPNFDLPFWDGLESLILTYPAIGWLTRALHDRSAEDALTQALQIVDDSFGFHPLLATSRQKLSLRILSSRGQIAHLVAFFAD